MRRTILILLSFFTTAVYAQFASPLPYMEEGVTIGLEKNYSAFLGYGWKSGFFLNAKLTLVVDKVDYQSFRIEGGYHYVSSYVQLSASPFVASDWNGSFWNVGASIGVTANYFSQYARVGVQYVPYYDSDLKMKHGWSAAGIVNITKEIALLAEYSRKPDYRISYKRMYSGVMFRVNNLTVTPMLEIPIYDGGLHASHSSVVVGLGYRFMR